MRVSLTHGARESLERMPASEYTRVLNALNQLQSIASWNQLIASRSGDIRQLSYSSAEAHEVAYRELRTPLYSYRVGPNRLVLTLDRDEDNSPAIVILDVVNRHSLRRSRMNASDLTALETFSPAVQYGDWTAVAAADNGDFSGTLWDLLRRRNLIREDEFLIGVRAFNGENLQGEELSPIYVRAFAIPASTFEDAAKYIAQADPIEAREISLEMSVAEFFRLFKRFSIAMSQRGLNIAGREIATE